MTISSTVRRAGPYAGNGATSVFPFSFKVFDKTNVKVLLVNSLGASTQLTLDSDYSVAPAADQNSNPGGSITYPISGNPMPAGYSIVMLGDLPYDQKTSITNNGGFYPTIVEDMSDRSTIQIQQLAEVTSRALVITEAETTSPVLPNAAGRANSVLGFDALGNPTMMPLTASIGAGDMRVDIFIEASQPNPNNYPTFTAGVTTVLPLSRAPGSVDNTSTFFDTYYQGKDQVQSLVGNLLAYTAPIPVGTVRVYVKTGTTLSLSVPAVGTVADASVAPGTALAARINGWIDPKQYGCAGDGVTDDTVNFQRAEDAALAKGTHLFISAGVYRINATGITKRSGVNWFGAGAQQAILQGISGASNALVRGGAITGTRIFHVGLDFCTVAPFVTFMRNVWFDSFTDSELGCCYFSQQAIGFQADGGSNFVIRHNTFFQKTNEATPRTAYGTTVNEAIWINNSSANDYLIEGNKCQNVGTAFNGSNVTIVGNRIRSWGYGSGITTEQGTFEYTVVGNECIGGTGIDGNNVPPAGIELWSNRSVVAGNRCSFNAGMGINVGGTATVTGNVCIGNGTYSGGLAPTRYRAGIILRYIDANINGNSSVVVGNTCFDIGGNQLWGITDDGASCGDSTIADNILTGATAPMSLSGSRYDFKGPKLQAVVTGQAGFTLANAASGGGNSGFAMGGAQLGDKVTISINQNMQGLTAFGWATAAGTVAWSFLNMTGASVTIPNFTLYVAVEKPFNYANY